MPAATDTSNVRTGWISGARNRGGDAIRNSSMTKMSKLNPDILSILRNIMLEGMPNGEKEQTGKISVFRIDGVGHFGTQRPNWCHIG